MFDRRFTVAAASAFAFALLLAGCAVGPDFVQPDNGLQRAVLTPRTAGEYSAAVPNPVPIAWWSLFNDATLTALQKRALAANLDLQAAAARVEQSRAQLGIARSQLMPRVGAGAGYSREALSENGKFAALRQLRVGMSVQTEIDTGA